MKHVVKYQAHPWGREVWFTQNDKALEKLGDQFDLDLERDTCNGLCWGTAGNIVVIWVRPGASVGVLAHECTHAALDILKYCGINAHDADGEPMCYTIQRMVDTFSPHLLPPQSS